MPGGGGGAVLRISSDKIIIEGFLGFEIFDSGIFLGRKICKVSGDLRRDFWGYSK